MDSFKRTKIRILIIDDSSFVRSALSQIINAEDDFEVVGQATNGREGVEMAEKLKPDIITLDIMMPVMDGLEALSIITRNTSSKVIMISSLTQEGANATFTALANGAVDFICKEMGDTAISMIKLRKVVISKLKGLTQTIDEPEKVYSKPIQLVRSANIKLIGIGTSTGGPAALQKIIPAMPANFPVPIVVVQHMPTNFIGHFAERLNEISKINVQVAREGEVAVGGKVLIAPGGSHMKVKKNHSGHCTISLEEEPSGTLHKPSVDETFSSIASEYPKNALGIIMTGMGQDGLIGSRKMKEAGSFIFAEHQSTCVVYGMPKAIVGNKLADKVIPLLQIPTYMQQAVK